VNELTRAAVIAVSTDIYDVELLSVNHVLITSLPVTDL